MRQLTHPRLMPTIERDGHAHTLRALAFGSDGLALAKLCDENGINAWYRIMPTTEGFTVHTAWLTDRELSHVAPRLEAALADPDVRTRALAGEVTEATRYGGPRARRARQYLAVYTMLEPAQRAPALAMLAAGYTGPTADLLAAAAASTRAVPQGPVGAHAR